MQRIRQQKLRNPFTRYLAQCKREERKWHSFFNRFEDEDNYRIALNKYVCDEQDATKLKKQIT